MDIDKPLDPAEGILLMNGGNHRERLVHGNSHLACMDPVPKGQMFFQHS